MQTLDSRILDNLIRIHEKDGSEAPPKPDSLGYGSLGRQFYALELYKRTGDGSILTGVCNYLRWFSRYAEKNRSNNYSLFNGRSGVGFLSLAVFEITRKEEFLEMASRMAKEYAEGTTRAFRIFDKNGLFEGTSGILLFWLELYLQIKEEWMLRRMEECIFHLLVNAGMADPGVYWMKDLYELYPDTVIWPAGNAGIAFCLLRLGQTFHNAHLCSLAYSALNYEGNNGLVGLYAGTFRGFLQRHSPGEEMSFDIYNGWAGWGLAYREAYCITGDPEYITNAGRIASSMAEMLEYETKKPIHDLSFFKGLSGIGYSLLKIADPDGTPSLLLPRTGPDGNRNDAFAQGRSLFGLDEIRINSTLLRVNFPKTFSFLTHNFQQEFEQWLAARIVVDMKTFRDWVGGLPVTGGDDPMEESLMELLEREMLKPRVRKEYPPHPANDNMEYARRVEQLSQWPDEEILLRSLSISQRGFLLRREPPIDLSTSFSPDHFGLLFQSYGRKSFFIYVNEYHEIEAIGLGLSRLYVDLFEGTDTVGNVIEKIMSFLRSQDEQSIELLKKLYKSNDPDNFWPLVFKDILETIRSALMSDVLTFSENSFTNKKIPEYGTNDRKARPIGI